MDPYGAIVVRELTPVSAAVAGPPAPLMASYDLDCTSRTHLLGVNLVGEAEFH